MTKAKSQRVRLRRIEICKRSNEPRTSIIDHLLPSRTETCDDQHPLLQNL